MQNENEEIPSSLRLVATQFQDANRSIVKVLDAQSWRCPLIDGFGDVSVSCHARGATDGPDLVRLPRLVVDFLWPWSPFL